MNIIQNLLHAFSGVNLTAVLAVLGGYTGIAMILMSPLMSFVLKASWSTQKKNIAVWVACFGFSGLGMYIAHAFTGSLWDIGTWTAAWGALSVGATTLHDKIWGSNGTGISTWIEKNFFPGTDVPIPTEVDEILPAAKEIALDLLKGFLEAKGADIIKQATKNATSSMAGTAGAVPSEPQAQLGGPNIPANPVADTLYAKNATPLITPAPSVKAEAEAIAAAISAGIPVESIANNIETKAPGGSE